MDIGAILKIVGVGIIVAVAFQILSKAGREEQSTLVSIAGMVVILLFIMNQFGDLISSIRSVFGI